MTLSWMKVVRSCHDSDLSPYVRYKLTYYLGTNLYSRHKTRTSIMLHNY